MRDALRRLRGWLESFARPRAPEAFPIELHRGRVYVLPTRFGLFEMHVGFVEFVRHVGLMWLGLGVGGLAFRTIQLFFIRDVQTGLVWATKIVTDPFNDIKLYHKAPLRLFQQRRGNDGNLAHEAH